jgi:hypothetical protein
MHSCSGPHKAHMHIKAYKTHYYQAGICAAPPYTGQHHMHPYQQRKTQSETP